MTQDEIIRMAREVWGERAVLPFNELKRFAALVAAHEREKEIKRVAEGHGWTQAHWTAYEESIAAAEREACAKVCDERVSISRDVLAKSTAGLCAAAIRARGEK